MECARKPQAVGLLKTTQFIDRRVRVSIHKTLNSSCGVIRCRELSGMTEEKIKTELQEQGVAEVHRLTVKRDTEKVPTNTLFLTFNTPEMLKEITVDYHKMKVALFVPSPMRCFNCNKFGHTSQRCMVAAKCPGCGKDKHEGRCEGPKLCSNCNGPHASSAKDCPKGSAAPSKTGPKGSAGPLKTATKGSAGPLKTAYSKDDSSSSRSSPTAVRVGRVLVDVKGSVHPRRSAPSGGTQAPPKPADSERLKKAERNLVLYNQYSALSDDEMDSSSIPPDWVDGTLHCPVELARLPSKLQGACPAFKTIQTSRDCISGDAVDKFKIADIFRF